MEETKREEVNQGINDIIPAETLSKIFQELKFSWLFTARLVCKKWAQNIDKHSFFKGSQRELKINHYAAAVKLMDILNTVLNQAIPELKSAWKINVFLDGSPHIIFQESLTPEQLDIIKKVYANLIGRDKFPYFKCGGYVNSIKRDLDDELLGRAKSISDLKKTWFCNGKIEGFEQIVNVLTMCDLNRVFNSDVISNVNPA